MGFFDTLFGGSAKKGDGLNVQGSCLLDKLTRMRSVKPDPRPEKYSAFLMEKYSIIGRIKETGDIPALLKIMETDIQIPGEVYYCYFGSSCSDAFSAIREISPVIPDQAVSILIEHTKNSHEGIRRESYQNLSSAYSKSDSNNRKRIDLVITNALKTETGNAKNTAEAAKRDILSYQSKTSPAINQEIVALLRANLDTPGKAEQLIDLLGVDAIPVFLDIMKSANIARGENAHWGIRHYLKFKSDKNQKDTLRTALAPVIEYLNAVIKDAKISSGAESFSPEVNFAIGTLGDIGDASSQAVLLVLKENVGNKIQKEGISTKYINTGVYAGYVTSKDDLDHVEQAISSIQKRL